MQQAGTKNFFRLNRGLNTEANELNFPDGFTTDECNYELLPDGSRRRRKGLAQESGGSGHTIPTVSDGFECQAYVWRNVGGDPDKTFIVHKFGNELHFSDDAETISTTYHADTIGLETYVVDSNTTPATVGAEAVSFATGRGHLFVTGKYLKPFYISYDSTGDDFTTHIITLRVRDFEGIDDGVGVETEPTDVTIPADHRYNLRNRGWKEDDLTTYETAKSKWPAKNAIWFRGYRRQTDVSYSDLDGIQTFSSDKIEDELFGNASAPQGSLFLDPLDTTYAATAAGGGSGAPISTWNFVAPDTPATGGTVEVTTTTVHGFTGTPDIVIEGTNGEYAISGFFETAAYNKIQGSHTITSIPSTTKLRFTVPATSNWDSWVVQYAVLGEVNGSETLTKSDGKALTVGPTAIEYYAGRVWYAGIPDSEWADTIFFSKIAQKPKSYGICAQEADPTDRYLSSITVADGGTIIIPGLGGVKDILAVRNSLLIFSDRGVWEVSGGDSVFTATRYRVRKLTDAECTSSYSPIAIDVGALYTGAKGVYQISPNQYTGQLEATNISEQLIQTKWNSIATAYQTQVQTVYDDALKRVYFLYGEVPDAGSKSGWTNHYTRALVLDFRVGAWYQFEFDSSGTDGILTAYAISASDSTADNKKVKWSCMTATTTETTCDLDQTDYVDFDGSESPLPFMMTGWDNIGDFQKRKQAPVITVYSKKTETGFTATGNGLDPDNESSTTMTAYWDWADNATTGKVGAADGSGQQVYRHVRGFQPDTGATTFASGYPVVVTRNKVRGRGRALQLKFAGAATKDTHLLGFTTNYRVTRKV